MTNLLSGFVNFLGSKCVSSLVTMCDDRTASTAETFAVLDDFMDFLFSSVNFLGSKVFVVSPENNSDTSEGGSFSTEFCNVSGRLIGLPIDSEISTEELVITFLIVFIGGGRRCREC